MSKSTSIIRRVHIPDIQYTLDQDEFNKLTDLLYEAYKGNTARVTRALGINRRTWNNWTHNPPTWPHWNKVIRGLIIDVISSLSSRRGIIGNHKDFILKRLSKIKDSHELGEDIERYSYELSQAEDHLRAILMRKGMFWDEIRLPAHCGGHSIRALQRGAQSLHIVKTQEGYGDEKRSYWRLPNADDD